MGFNIKFSYLLVVTLCVTVLASSYVSANYYTVPLISGNQSHVVKNPTISINDITISEIGITFNCIGNITGVGTSTCTAYSPHGTSIVTSTLTTVNDCVDFGDYDYTNDQNTNNIQSDYSITSSSASYFIRGNSKLTANTNDDYLIFEQNATKDYSNMVKNFYGASEFETTTSVLLSAWINENIAIYNGAGKCQNYVLQPTALIGHGWGCDGGGSAAYEVGRFIRLFPFNSSHQGIVNYNISKTPVSCSVMAGGDCTTGTEIGYFQKGGSAVTIVTGVDADGELSLTPNREYAFYIASYFKGRGTGSGTGSCSGNEAEYYSLFNISIYTPNYECSDYSVCDSGSQFRTCVDLNGVSDDKLESRLCSSLPTATLNLGFENTRTENVWKSTPYWWLGTCPMNVNLAQVEFPHGWEINVETSNRYITDNVTGETGLLFDFMELSGEQFFDGTKSLKMWNIPPSESIPTCSNQTFNLLHITNGTSCTVIGDGNYSVSLNPNINKKINETYLLTQNMTFDYPNMTLSSYIRKCEEVVQQWSGNSSVFGWCGEGYYTNDKTDNWDISKTRFIFQLENDDTGEKTEWLFSTDITTWSKKEIRLENLSTISNYTLSVGLYSSSPTVSSNVQCAYIDGIELNGFEGTVPCESYCDGFVRHEATVVEPNGCVFDVISPSPVCVFGEVLNAFNLCNDVCDCDSSSSTYLALFDGDNSSGSCVFETFENSSQCEEQCITNVELTTPSEDVVNAIEDRLGSELPDWSKKLLSPVVLILGILAVLMVIFAKWSGSWEIATVSGFIGLIIAGTIFTELVWIVIVVIVVAGLLFANKMKNPSG